MLFTLLSCVSGTRSLFRPGDLPVGRHYKRQKGFVAPNSYSEALIENPAFLLFGSVNGMLARRL
ncbi:MAG: hypothetical protein HZA68_21050 [Rhodovulum sp.]|nr:hypothetical protein [Rhodovulum sp.]